MRTIRAYHIAAVLYLAAAAVAGVLLSGNISPDLRVRGWFIVHAYIAFMGFGTLIIFGHQCVLAPYSRYCELPRAGEQAGGRGLFVTLNAALWLIWAMFLAQGLTGNAAYYYGSIAGGAVVLGCLAVFARRLFAGVDFELLKSNLPLRFFATALIICCMAYGQMMYVTFNMIHPVLPFAHDMPLRVNYLAFSFPMSLTIMACIRLPFHHCLKQDSINHRWLWESQFVILVFGVFALFFSLILKRPPYERVFVALDGIFAGMLFLSIVFLASAMYRDRREAQPIPWRIWRYYVAAVSCLALAGTAGFLLGYGVDRHAPYYYFLIQVHIHLALLGWIGMGMSGVVFYLLSLAGREPGVKGDLNFYMMLAGITLTAVGIFLRNIPLRAAGGVAVAAAVVMLFACMTESLEK